MNADEISTTDFLKIDKNEHISKLIGELVNEKQSAAVIFDGDRYLGITKRNALIRTNINFSSAKVGNIVEKVPVLKGTEEIPEAARLLFTADAPLLPIIKEGEVVGVVKSIELIKYLEERKAASKKAKDIMLQNPPAIKENQSVGEAIHIIHSKRINKIPVVDDKGNLIGIITTTDLIKNFIAKLKGKDSGGARAEGARGSKGDKTKMESFPITSIYSRYLVATLREDSAVSEAVRLIREHCVSSLIVVKDKKPIGIVDIRDLLKLF